MSQAAAVPRPAAMFRRRSVQPSRRAVLHVQAAGDPPVPPDLAAWYTERAFHFYVTGVRLPSQAPVGARPRARYLSAAFADLDAAREDLLGAEGMASVIVTARSRGAIVAALWHDQRPQVAVDALILHEPALPPGVSLSLDVGCPVLVLTESGSQPADTRRRPGWRARSAAEQGGLQLGAHVTWLRLAESNLRALGSADADPGAASPPDYFDELGRWLGAYMYGSVRDRLL
jgi:alpha-beta hydrolase superfamily lysophospholipase